MGHGNSVFLWNETEATNCKGGLEKDVFETLLSVFSNLATLNLCTEVMQQKASAWVYYIPVVHSPFLFCGECLSRIILYYSAWAVLRCLSLHRGNAKA